MFVGHIGVALIAGKADRSINLGLLAFAALFLDVLLWSMVLLGWEQLAIPENFPETHQPRFTFPYSHGLVAAACWSAGAACLIAAWRRADAQTNAKSALVVAATVFSHWLLDVLVHQPEMPLAGMNSPRVGLGLWNSMPLALMLEASLAIGGLCLYVARSGLSRAKWLGLVATVVLTLAFTVAGMTVAPAPPGATSMAASSLITIAFICLLVAWIGAASPVNDA